MAHINLPPDVPGIIGLLNSYPETAKPLNMLAQVLLRGDSTLTKGERELIAGYVSAKNDCYFCSNSHLSAAGNFLNNELRFDNGNILGMEKITLSPKMKALLNISAKVQQGGKNVSSKDISEAKDSGATDKEIHDTVLIAAAFCMYNRYVDGLDTFQPKDNEAYDVIGKRIASNGYSS